MGRIEIELKSCEGENVPIRKVKSARHYPTCIIQTIQIEHVFVNVRNCYCTVYATIAFALLHCFGGIMVSLWVEDHG